MTRRPSYRSDKLSAVRIGQASHSLWNQGVGEKRTLCSDFDEASGTQLICKLPSSLPIFARGTNIASIEAILKLICSPTLLLRIPVPAYSC